MIIILWIYGILLRKIIHVYIKNISRWAQCLIITLLLTLLLRLLPLLLLVFIISRTIVKFLFSAMLFFKKISLLFFFFLKGPFRIALSELCQRRSIIAGGVIMHRSAEKWATVLSAVCLWGWSFHLVRKIPGWSGFQEWWRVWGSL